MLPIVKHRAFLPNLTDEFFGKEFFTNVWDYNSGDNIPAVNVVETNDDFKIEVAAPGLQKEDFRIDLHNNVLSVSSEKEEKKEESDGKFMRREFGYSTFKRSFTLPNIANTEKVQASHKDGILSITIPKKEEAKEKPIRRIDII